ncbi:secA translation cis-regulator SecM [Rodentibacter caecimuris]|uniref:DUF2547 family protein n=1 Tax=Rodentibacter caecimuris TaxID=1796644 RepID=A0ABX3L2W9_9PAST|nr:hypothetical protein BKG89_01655 [Rodentibacter heylii]
MILRKGKHNFWSQLFISMIAIFALPNAQATEKASDLNNSNQQSLQQTQQFSQISLSVKNPLRQQVLSEQSQLSSIKLNEIRPHFFSRTIKNSAPIRAGPFFLVNF